MNKTIADFKDLDAFYPYPKIDISHYMNGLNSSQLVPYKHTESLFTSIEPKIKRINTINILYFLLENNSSSFISSGLQDDEVVNNKYYFFKKEIINLVKNQKITQSQLYDVFTIASLTDLISDNKKVMEFFIENNLVDITSEDKLIKKAVLKNEAMEKALTNFKETTNISQKLKYYLTALNNNSVKIIREIHLNQEKYKDLIEFEKDGINQLLINTLEFGNSEAIVMCLDFKYLKNNQDELNKTYCYTTKAVSLEVKNRGKNVSRDTFIYKKGFKNEGGLRCEIEKNRSSFSPLLELMIKDNYKPTINTLFHAHLKDEKNILKIYSNEEIQDFIVSNNRFLSLESLYKNPDFGRHKYRYRSQINDDVYFDELKINFIFNLFNAQKEKSAVDFDINFKKMLESISNNSAELGLEIMNLAMNYFGKNNVLKNMPYSRREWTSELRKEYLLNELKANKDGFETKKIKI